MLSSLQAEDALPSGTTVLGHLAVPKKQVVVLVTSRLTFIVLGNRHGKLKKLVESRPSLPADLQLGPQSKAFLRLVGPGDREIRFFFFSPVLSCLASIHTDLYSVSFLDLDIQVTAFEVLLSKDRLLFLDSSGAVHTYSFDPQNPSTLSERLGYGALSMDNVSEVQAGLFWGKLRVYQLVNGSTVRMFELE